MGTSRPAFAWFMHHVFARLQPAFLWQLRRELTRRARGRVLEVGAGDGVNLALYDPARVDHVFALEPDPAMRRYLLRAAVRAPVPVAVLGGDAEHLPLADGTVDSLVYSLVLCTARQPAAAMAEARRVLRPGGRLLLLEHVVSEHPRWRRVQQAVNPVWSAVGGGCHLDRDTLATVRHQGFSLRLLRALPGALTPLVLAEATRSAPFTR
ncbi:class I SAM-dependent methyltransferase [Carboxydochorda subterranea]|uniref:Class I SAM-dependent methyltransferase n=1 Tax=Carboxydichorda subterranea TaxID=3109565 RepID=A0ABZ1C174_9FIRM|nr:class I SAM-dependent methyltransferase [Limnochorda sp. L945t]WRP18058.1 class I SAM-dependent methyltransferase [Limnochorda sp. L945t]